MNKTSADARKYLRNAVATAVLVGLMAVLASACGSSSKAGGSGSSGGSATASGSSTSSGGSSSSDGASASAVAQAQAAVKKFEVPTKYAITSKTSKPIPTGKHVDFIDCGAPVCAVLGQAVGAAAKNLGWTESVIATKGTPSSVAAGWASAVEQKPAAVFASGFNSATFASSLKQLKAMNAPVFDSYDFNPSGKNGIALTLATPAQVRISGVEMADWVIADTKGKANVLYASVPSFAIQAPIESAFKAQESKLCPSCGFASLNIPVTAIGTTAPNLIVSYLRAHPSVNYVALGTDDTGIGLPAALKAAGLSGKVKFLGNSPSTTSLNYVADGEEAATVNDGYYEMEYTEVDAAARYITGQSLTPDVLPKNFYWIETKGHLTDGTNFGPVDPSLNSTFKTSLGKG